MWLGLICCIVPKNEPVKRKNGGIMNFKICYLNLAIESTVYRYIFKQDILSLCSNVILVNVPVS